VFGLIFNRPPLSPLEWVVAAAIVLSCTYVIVRAFFIGVWVTRRTLVARSWFRTFALSADEIHRCDRVPYSGMLFGYGDSTRLSMLAFTLESGSIVTVRASIASERTSQRQVEQIRAAHR
jgi:hypothetical protein